MATTDTASHALLIDGESVETARSHTGAAKSFSNDNEAFALANDTRCELEAGTVWINEHLAIGSEMPHGGVKGSGFGKDMSMHALEEYSWYDAVCPR